MPCLEWSKLNNLQLGRYAEYYAKMEFASYGFDVYTSEVDNHGVDFVIKNEKGCFFEVQVKSSFLSNYTFIKKTKMNCKNESFIVCFLKFKEGLLPEVYLLPAVEWQSTNALLRDKDYTDPSHKSTPEWGINHSLKNQRILDQYRSDDYIQSLLS